VRLLPFARRDVQSCSLPRAPASSQVSPACAAPTPKRLPSPTRSTRSRRRESCWPCSSSGVTSFPCSLSAPAPCTDGAGLSDPPSTSRPPSSTSSAGVPSLARYNSWVHQSTVEQVQIVVLPVEYPVDGVASSYASPSSADLAPSLSSSALSSAHATPRETPHIASPSSALPQVPPLSVLDPLFAEPDFAPLPPLPPYPLTSPTAHVNPLLGLFASPPQSWRHTHDPSLALDALDPAGPSFFFATPNSSALSPKVQPPATDDESPSDWAQRATGADVLDVRQGAALRWFP